MASPADASPGERPDASRSSAPRGAYDVVDDPALLARLDVARGLGFLGPGPLADQVRRAVAFVEAWRLTERPPPARILDLGSGAGLPGLVLALAWPRSAMTLLDAHHRRAEVLQRAVVELGVADRVTVALGRAEELGRGPLRFTHDLVTARGFGPPAVTAECGAAFARPGGYLAVADPPGGGADRWPDDGVAQLGLRTAGLVTEPAAVRLLLVERPLPDRYPRRTGTPAKRPLWGVRE